MAFGTDPDLALRPFGQFAQFPNLRMARGRAIWKRQSFRIEDADLGSEVLEQPSCLVGEKTAVLNLTERPVKD